MSHNKNKMKFFWFPRPIQAPVKKQWWFRFKIQISQTGQWWHLGGRWWWHSTPKMGWNYFRQWMKFILNQPVQIKKFQPKSEIPSPRWYIKPDTIIENWVLQFDQAPVYKNFVNNYSVQKQMPKCKWLLIVLKMVLLHRENERLVTNGDKIFLGAKSVIFNDYCWSNNQ